MSNINWQLCEQEQAFKLKDLGCLQQGAFFYQQGIERPFVCPDLLPMDLLSCIAYTAAELGVMLPDHTPTKRMVIRDFFSKELRSIWSCETELNPFVRNQDVNIGGGPSEASIRAMMLIYLLEQNHITVDEVNARLEAVQS